MFLQSRDFFQWCDAMHDMMWCTKSCSHSATPNLHGSATPNTDGSATPNLDGSARSQMCCHTNAPGHRCAKCAITQTHQTHHHTDVPDAPSHTNTPCHASTMSHNKQRAMSHNTPCHSMLQSHDAMHRMMDQRHVSMWHHCKAKCSIQIQDMLSCTDSACCDLTKYSHKDM